MREHPPIEDNACVLVRVNLRPSTYQVYARRAKELKTDVGDILSRIADRSIGVTTPTPTTEPVVAPRPRRANTGGRPKRPRVEDDLDARIRALNAAGVSDTAIANQIGLSQASTSRRRNLLGLQSPTPKGGRRTAA